MSISEHKYFSYSPQLGHIEVVKKVISGIRLLLYCIYAADQMHVCLFMVNPYPPRVFAASHPPSSRPKRSPTREHEISFRYPISFRCDGLTFSVPQIFTSLVMEMRGNSKHSFLAARQADYMSHTECHNGFPFRQIIDCV